MANKYQYTVQGVDYDVEIEEVEGNIAKVSVNGIPFEVEMKQPIKAASRPSHVHVEASKPVQHATAAAPVAAPKPAQQEGNGQKVTAPLPGTITEVRVKVGDTVKEGDTVIVLEAMKMQNNIGADCAGTITSVLVNQGETVMEGATLVTIG
jgi:biotin carboxyl carrier protein